MGLLQKLKSALGLDGARSADAGTAPPRDVDVTVEREPSSETEDAVKGTETAPAETAGVEPDAVDESIDDATTDESDEAPDESDAVATAEDSVDVAGEPVDEAEEPVDEAAEPDEEPDEATDADAGAADESTDPVTEISGIGPAYGQRLADAGVETVADLAAADPDELESETEISASRIRAWTDAAEEY